MNPILANALAHPPREFTLLPFWFWNDVLSESELLRQIADFEAHGVHGFLIHPRVGLPRDTGWMSEKLLGFMRFAVEEAARCEMMVVLYDEGMYPSGSSSGQVVAEDASFACRCLAKIELEDNETPELPDGHNLVAVVPRANGQRMAIIDRPVASGIRGLHYIETEDGEGPDEDFPPAADLLNPASVACFIRLVYDRYATELGAHFGQTIIGIFTDEPGLLGKHVETEKVMPGTTGILQHVERILGYDFTPHLPALWHDDEPDAQKHRAAYHRALQTRLEETYYQPLSEWCERHGIALMGHPAKPDAIGQERYFHIPGQDIVWRYIEPNKPSALEGEQSTQGKCTSSAMVHQGRRRNSNECYGAYGHELTYEETKWIADWLFVRGVNMLLPHAFYYSVRGHRLDERPPDVGPNSAWWDDYKAFAEYSRRLCWLNTDSRHVCSIAILGEEDHLPWRAAKICFQNQLDFNYLTARDLEDATVDAGGIHLRDMHYRVLLVDGMETVPERARAALETLSEAGRLLHWLPEGDALWYTVNGVRTLDELVSLLRKILPPDLIVSPPAPDLRYRHVEKEGAHFCLLFNEGPNRLEFDLDVDVDDEPQRVDLFSGAMKAASWRGLTLQPYETMLLCVASS